MKIFRKQREEAGVRKRMGKYLLYALGEIILVAAGILIAVNVNNWNDRRKADKEALVFFEDLRLDLRRDTVLLGTRVRMIEQVIKFKENDLKLESYENESMLKLEYLTNSYAHNFEINKGTYMRMQGARAWNMKNYQDLYKNVTRYYLFGDTHMKYPKKWDAEIHIKEFEFWNMQDQFEINLRRHDSLPFRQDKTLRRQRMIEVLQSVEGRNFLRISIFRDQIMLHQYKEGYERAKNLIQQLEELLPPEENVVRKDSVG